MNTDDWFLGALSVVATRPELLMNVVLTKIINQFGAYEFQFYKNGAWINVVVDDWIPCHK